MSEANELTLDQARQRQQEGLRQARASVEAVPADIDLKTAGIKAVRAWVGDDIERAQEALTFENEDRDEGPRASLVKHLERITAAGE